MNKKAKNVKLSGSDFYSKTSDEFEEWEGDYDFIEKKDYQGLLKYRRRIAAERPDDFDAQIKLGEAYNLAGNYTKALEFLSTLIKEAPSHDDIQYYILDALFATGRNENDFDWIEKPVEVKLTKDVLDTCYNFLKPKRKPVSLSELSTIFILKGYVTFSEEELLNALADDKRFAIDDPDNSVYFAEIQVTRKRDRPH